MRLEIRLVARLRRTIQGVGSTLAPSAARSADFRWDRT